MQQQRRANASTFRPIDDHSRHALALLGLAFPQLCRSGRSDCPCNSVGDSSARLARHLLGLCRKSHVRTNSIHRLRLTSCPLLAINHRFSSAIVPSARILTAAFAQPRSEPCAPGPRPRPIRSTDITAALRLAALDTPRTQARSVSLSLSHDRSASTRCCPLCMNGPCNATHPSMAGSNTLCPPIPSTNDPPTKATSASVYQSPKTPKEFTTNTCATLNGIIVPGPAPLAPAARTPVWQNSLWLLPSPAISV